MKYLLVLIALSVAILSATNPTTDEYIAWMKAEFIKQETDELRRVAIIVLGTPILTMQTTRQNNTIFSIYKTEIDKDTSIEVVGALGRFFILPERLKAKWVPGVHSKLYQHVVAASKEGQWEPEDGYVWVGRPAVTGVFDVKWAPGRKSSTFPHVVASTSEGRWLPEDGYTWVLNPPINGDLRVKWLPGAPSTKYPHIIAMDVEGKWIPEAGYVWVSSPPSLADFRVRPASQDTN